MGLFYMMNPFDTLIYSRFFPKKLSSVDTFSEETDLNLLFFYEKISFLSIPEKWVSYKKVLNNIFLGDEKKEEVFGVISKIQRTIHGLYRLKYLWQRSRAKWYNTADLYMNTISPTDRGTIVIFENNTKYIFQLRELIHVVQSSLSNCCHFFPNPVPCKNPYTNLPLHKSNLYNIYFAIRQSQHRMPLLFEEFFRHNFNLNRFLAKNEELINDEYLKTYVENNCLTYVLEYVYDMFKEHEIRCHIHKDFPKDQLFQIMKPYLSLYFISNYAINSHKKGQTFRNLHRKLHLFENYNKHFGRRKVQFVSKNPFSPVKQCVYVFDDKYIPLKDIDNDSFLTSHLYPPDDDSPQHIEEHSHRTEDEDEDEDDEDDEDDEQSETESEDFEINIIVNQTYENDDDNYSLD
jgi:hypothetical protein